ncbi:MAG: hypothetical protein DMF67_19880, partial [Acidobacteria bacterium]
MTNKTPFLLALCLLVGLVLLACGGGSSDNAANTSNTAAGNKAAASNTSTASGDKVGVPECDDFIAKYEACINSKVPESARSMVKANLDSMRKAWKDAAATPQGKAGLAQGCKQALDNAKTTMGS